jgi:prepilin peptidase CpaA
MNLAVSSPQWLVWIVGALLAAAAIEDAARLRISNLICVGVLVLGLVAMAMVPSARGLWQNFAVFTAVLVAGTFLFSAGKLGGGDVKLLATLSLWFSFDGALMLLSSVFLAGGLVAMAYLARRFLLTTPRPGGALPTSTRIPYGIAIALGGTIALALAR